MEVKSTEICCLVFLLAVLLTKITYGQQIIEGSFDVVEDHVPTGNPIAEVIVRSKIECVALCQITEHCTATETEKSGAKTRCKLFDQTVTVSQKSPSSETHTFAVKGKWTNKLFQLIIK